MRFPSPLLAIAIVFSLPTLGETAQEVSDLLTTLANRPGVHATIEFNPSYIRTWTPSYQPAVKAFAKQKLSTLNPDDIPKVAEYLSRKGNECTIKTLQSLKNLLDQKGAHFDALTRARYESNGDGPDKPTLTQLQRIRMWGDFYFVGYFKDQEADEDVMMWGCKPGSTNPRSDDIREKLKCEKVDENFDYSAIVYRNPIQDIHISAPSLTDKGTEHNRSARTWNLLPHGVPVMRGFTWEFGSGTMGELLETWFIDELKKTNQYPNQSVMESRCEVGVGLLAMVFGIGAEEVKAGYRLP